VLAVILQDGGGGSDKDMNDDIEADNTLSVLDQRLEAVVRRIEQDPVVNAYYPTFIINNDQLCSDAIHGGLAPGM